MMAIFGLLMFCGPYIYYTIKVYNYIHEHAETQAGPDFTTKPQLSDLWIAVVSAVCIYFVKFIVLNGCHPMILYLGRFSEGDTDEEKNYKTTCTVEKLWHSIWHIFASVVAYWYMKDEKWVPWFLGSNGQFSSGFENTPFTPMSMNNYYAGLVFLGYPLA